MTLLTVGLARQPRATPTLDMLTASSGRSAIAALRLLDLDLLLAGHHLPDMSVWQVMRLVRTAWPRQRWALVSPDATADVEVKARALGALHVFDDVPDAAALARVVESLQPRIVAPHAEPLAQPVSQAS